MEDSRSTNYWPGFVDVLANVVLTLVFVLVIFVFAVTMIASKAKKQMEIADQYQIVALKHENELLKEQVAALTEQVNQLKALKDIKDKKTDDSADVHAVASHNVDKQININDEALKNEKNKGHVEIKNSEDMVTLTFPTSSAAMDEKSEAQLGHVLDAKHNSFGKSKIVLRSIIGNETYSIARRLAYYRVIKVRNNLITKQKYSPANISISIVTPSQPEEGRVEIFPQKE